MAAAGSTGPFDFDAYSSASSPASPSNPLLHTEDAKACSSGLPSQTRHIIGEELAIATARISEDRMTDIKEIGGQTLALETRADDTTTVLEAHEEDISFLRDEIGELKLKLENLGNRSRHCNLRIRGLPESIIDLHGTITALFQELAPNILSERLV